MKLVNTYLSDEELEQLIAHIEQKELVAAPPDLMEDILGRMEVMLTSSEEVPEVRRGITERQKIKEFRSYCFRVVTSVAATVAMIFLLPKLGNLQWTDVSATKQVILEEAVCPEREVLWKYTTKEAFLNDTGIIRRTFGGTHIFDAEDRLNIFNGKNGG